MTEHGDILEETYIENYRHWKRNRSGGEMVVIVFKLRGCVEVEKLDAEMRDIRK